MNREHLHRLPPSKLSLSSTSALPQPKPIRSALAITRDRPLVRSLNQLRLKCQVHFGCFADLISRLHSGELSRFQERLRSWGTTSYMDRRLSGQVGIFAVDRREPGLVYLQPSIRKTVQVADHKRDRTSPLGRSKPKLDERLACQHLSSPP
jgi:hypothetical protein